MEGEEGEEGDGGEDVFHVVPVDLFRWRQCVRG